MTVTPSPQTAGEPEQPTFADFGVDERVVDALASAGIVHPFPIQQLTLPVALQRHDIIGQAKTGTGKTLGFGIPLLASVVSPGEEGFDSLAEPGRPQAMVVVPTRELAIQVAADLATASSHRSVRIICVYGGRAYAPQISGLATGVEVIVGTPGRMLDLLKQRHLLLKHVQTVVLDEADEMLDLGFLPDVEALIAATPPVRHTMLFSATMPGPVVAMARRYMSQATHIRVQDPEDQQQTVKEIRQFAYRAHALDKVEVLARLLQAEGRGRTIVFTRTKRTAAKVADDLSQRGFAAAAIHGDLGQGAREQALRAFRKGKVDVLVATDVAARGIDVDDVTHVVNYQAPEDEKIYLHRTGRTGRAGNMGTAVTFVDWDDVPRWSMVNRLLEIGIPEPVETYSTSEHLYRDLGIPAGASGVLPRSQRVREGLGAEEIEDLGETGGRSKGGGSGRRKGGRGRSGGGSAGGGGGAGNGSAGGGRQGGRQGGRRGGNSAEADTHRQHGRGQNPRNQSSRSQGIGSHRERRRTRGNR
ncbi:MAG: DEAD/DEAH box helicase [Micrococcales bacterium]|nr:DEAD/DEAH box helicase [Micrococcales bacterium]